jgi:coenzyme F420-reducing hydrogenase delta subunit
LPDARLEPLREEIKRLCAAGTRNVVVFRCAHTAAAESTAAGEVAVIDVPCLAMIPPPFVDFIVHRALAAGVMFAGCREDDCYERLGNRWTELRIAARRDPYLRARVPRERVALSWAGAGRSAIHRRSVSEFRGWLAALGPFTRDSPRNLQSAWRASVPRVPRLLRYAAQAGLLVAVGSLLGLLSAAPAIRLLGADESVITLSFSHAAHRRQECHPLSATELAQRQPNMRRPSDCPRGRWPVHVELLLNDRLIYRGVHKPAGLWSDGPSSVFRRFRVPAGVQHLRARLKDSGAAGEFDYRATQTVSLRPGQNLVIEFDPERGFVFR